MPDSDLQVVSPSTSAISAIKSNLVSTTDVQKFVYSGTIVLLYAAFEQFVEGLMQETVQKIATYCKSYKELPETLRRHHQLLTLEVLNAMESGRYHGPLNGKDLIAGLSHELGELSPVRVNHQVYSHHTANFRFETVRSLFNRAGIDLSSLEQDPIYIAAVKEVFPDENNPFFAIDDLAERRNAVAHGGTVELLAPELLLAYIRVVEAFAGALYSKSASVVAEYVAQTLGRDLGVPDRVFRNSIAGYYNVSSALEKGDVICIVSDGGKASVCCEILELQSKDTSITAAYEGSEVGVKLSLRVTKRNRLILFPREMSFLVLPNELLPQAQTSGDPEGTNDNG
ncbi:hypothetical protein LWF15_15850 [Kineosporia rhizophila]|uniref:MAE_28990/MAE_18760 family HEPN-like nuclease n=1 Tax=Kineosporia rhizophila TaxID=84633 RepID=UPI001E573C3E|nr:hypothetical protein [Kineosporia rhizophila]